MKLKGDDIMFSVVIPSYNRVHTIERAINSVLQQTYQEFEIIVVDDGSKDSTAEIVSDFSRNDIRVRYVYQENQGTQAARNHGLHLACGKYISFLDSDDEWLPDFLETTKKKFDEDSSLGCVYCWTGYEDVNGRICLAHEDYLEGNIYVEALKQGFITGPLSLVIKRTCFDEIGEWDESFKACQDDDICFRLAKRFRFALIPKILAVAHTSYDGCEERISASPNRVANAWWQLWHKYEADVVEYCGKRAIAKHYLECANRFEQAGNQSMRNEAYSYALYFYDYNALLQDFLVNISQQTIYCYGAGTYAEEIGGILLKTGISIKAFFVSDGNTKADELLGIPVLYISDLPKAGSFIVLLATTKKYHKELKTILQEHLINDVYSLDDEVFLVMKMNLLCRQGR